MSQEKDDVFGDVTVYCDEPNCNEEFVHEGEDGFANYVELNQEIKDRGWRTYKRDSEFLHICYSCRHAKGEL